MRSYCSIFDKNYLFQAITLYNSLKDSSSKFHFYALCIDMESYDLLTAMNLENLIPIKVSDIMTPELTEVQKRTAYGQFCWVCQPIICQYILDEFNVDMVVYLEADSLFFSDPEVLLDELGDDSVSLVPHNFSSERYDNTEVAGKFCVQFNAFRNNEQARAVLSYWKSECFKYTKEKPMDFPGQTCLDNWPSKFAGVKIIANIGAGVAPWNVQKFKIQYKNSILCVDETPVVFYHYHAFGTYKNGSYELGVFPLSKQAISLFYSFYISKLKETEAKVHQTDSNFKFKRLYDNPKTFKDIANSSFKYILMQYVRNIKRRIKGTYHVFPAEYFNIS